MKRFFTVWPSLAILFLLFSCNKDNGRETGPLKFELSSTEMSVSNEGGQYQMLYTLENPVDTASVRASCVESWVYGFTDAGNAVTFFVAANEVDSVRTANVVVRYMDVTCEFTVTQEASPVPPAPSFEITIKDVTYNSCSYEVIPSDKEMTYIPDRCSRLTYWDLFTPEETPDRFIQEQLDYLQGWS
ncbi:MAG: BACON domain-containing protein, partial [Bacteroidetes bacterium]|nr:BACON domain-containing protein [Candidatus Cryptobacteroides avicola]